MAALEIHDEHHGDDGQGDSGVWVDHIGLLFSVNGEEPIRY